MITTKTMMITDFTFDELSAITKTASLIQTIHDRLYECTNDIGTMTSVKTGECCDVEDLQRVLGILDGLLTNKQWTLE